MFSTLGIVIASLVGIATSWYVHRKRVRKEKMVCMLGEDCQNVLDSKYSTIIFGVSNELWGILYFGVTAVYYMAAYFYSPLAVPPFSTVALLGATGAAAYSIYLIGIQAFTLKKWCEKCLVLSFSSFIIFLIVLYKIF